MKTEADDRVKHDTSKMKDPSHEPGSILPKPHSIARRITTISTGRDGITLKLPYLPASTVNVLSLAPAEMVMEHTTPALVLIV
ncbi:hypothetical protein VNI00_014800 [Paramarasmius palmivorus]|uniref:Uncharacterized protein n=1 Tax=Paramarasmius palmivorus TaxID=297713 RepID=A0AAW0BQ28_9AGAR